MLERWHRVFVDGGGQAQPSARSAASAQADGRLTVS
jgi:hypothetical protein